MCHVYQILRDGRAAVLRGVLQGGHVSQLPRVRAHRGRGRRQDRRQGRPRGHGEDLPHTVCQVRCTFNGPSHFMTYLCAAGMASPAYCKYFYALTKYFDVAYLVTGALSAMRSFTVRSSRWTASSCAGSAGSRSAGARVMKYLPCVTAGRGQELRRVQQARGGGLHGLQRQVRLSSTVKLTC